MTEFELESLLKLYSIPGIGAGKMRNLITRFGSAQAVLNAPIQKLITVQGIEKSTAVKIKKEVNSHFVETQLRYINEHNIKVISFWDRSYPPLLKKIYDNFILYNYQICIK